MNCIEDALVACDRSCCICHKFCGIKMEIHHIKQRADGGEDTFDNYIPLCFDCHAEMGKADPKHNKGKRYTEAELKRHRDNWYKKVREGSSSCYRESDSEADKKLFTEICDVFTPGMRYWLKEADIGGYHPLEVFNPLFDLFHKNKDPFFEFINVEIEKSKAKLLSSINDFLDYKAANTFVKDLAGERMAVTRQWMVNHEDWKPQGMSYEDCKQKFEEEAEKINTLATAVWDCYDEFARQNRRLLNL